MNRVDELPAQGGFRERIRQIRVPVYLKLLNQIEQLGRAIKHPGRSFLAIEGSLASGPQRGRESFSGNDSPHGKRVLRKRLPTPFARFHQEISGRVLTIANSGRCSRAGSVLARQRSLAGDVHRNADRRGVDVHDIFDLPRVATSHRDRHRPSRTAAPLEHASVPLL